jgi:uncharacterized protein
MIRQTTDRATTLYILLLAALFCIILPVAGNASVALPGSGADDPPRNILLKRRGIEHSPFRLQEDRSDDELWDAFMLVEKANSGDAPAMHELGISYLMGRNFTPDTVKAAYWIGRAAAKHLWTAEYNYSILLNNGWGVDWNPFEAFRLVKETAERHMTEAEYMYGLFCVEGLVIPADYPEAYRWISMAADSGYTPAKDILKEFAQRGLLSRMRRHAPAEPAGQGGGKNSSPALQNPALQPVILDVSEDTVAQPGDSVLVSEALRQGQTVADTAVVDQEGLRFSPEKIAKLGKQAEAGSPEALTLLGRIFQEGAGVPRDRVRAAACYVRAIRLDSPRSPYLLWKMLHDDDEFFAELKRKVDDGDPAAAFAWSGIVDFGFDNQLTQSQALGLLVSSAERKYTEAIVQLGICYYSGHWVRQDRERAMNLFFEAARLGSPEAKVRLNAIGIESSVNGANVSALVDSLRSASADGSLLAQSVLGYCYQTGRGVTRDVARAVDWYRQAWQRGSRTAAAALRKMYDDLRPTDKEYRIPD